MTPDQIQTRLNTLRKLSRNAIERMAQNARFKKASDEYINYNLSDTLQPEGGKQPEVGMQQGEAVTQAEYDQLIAAGYSPEDIAADGITVGR